MTNVATPSPLVTRFVLHWGEMGTRWGINRTVAQIHALLFVSPRPLTAEDISDALGVARSNVSTSLRELQGWGIVKIVHVLGDRRDHFISQADVWEMFQTILAERKKREFDPTLAELRACLVAAEAAGPNEAHTRERLAALAGFFGLMSAAYDQVSVLPPTGLAERLGLGAKVLRLLGLRS